LYPVNIVIGLDLGEKGHRTKREKQQQDTGAAHIITLSLFGRHILKIEIYFILICIRVAIFWYNIGEVPIDG